MGPKLPVVWICGLRNLLNALRKSMMSTMTSLKSLKPLSTRLGKRLRSVREARKSTSDEGKVDVSKAKAVLHWEHGTLHPFQCLLACRVSCTGESIKACGKVLGMAVSNKKLSVGFRVDARSGCIPASRLREAKIRAPNDRQS